MKKLQQLLDEHGELCKCHDWDGWVKECMQHPEMVVNKFNEIVVEFKKPAESQISNALIELRQKCYDVNWCKNQPHYRSLLGDNKPTNQWLHGVFK